ncbi:MAG TPA: hypothetical protein VJP77_03760 [Planctomycetota bacterium]|nr:hypothetical protein [Planctomycetota bacterium]
MARVGVSVRYHFLPTVALLLMASTGLSQVFPDLIVDCGEEDEYQVDMDLTIQVLPGQDPVTVGSAVIAGLIADKWMCSVCTTPNGQLFGCLKGPTGPADPSEFTISSAELVGGIWIISGHYSGGIEVSCRPCP